MSDERWLRDVLRAATVGQPVLDDRATGALRLATARKRQRLAMASFSAVLAVFVASSLTGGTDTSGLNPVSPTASASASETPYVDESPTAEPGDPEGTAEPDPEWAGPGKPIPADERRGLREPDPQPIDLYFLLDGTGSMGGYDEMGTMRGVVRALRSRGADVQYGYGYVRDDSGPGGLVVRAPMYERVAPIQPRPRLEERQQVVGGDDPDGQTFGLMGATGWTDGTWITESQPAGFRTGSRRFVVLVTDAPMHDGGTTGYSAGSNYPTIDEAVAALNDQSVMAASIMVIGNSDADEVREDLNRVAEGTHAIAARTIDCDGDGRYYEFLDVRRGDPLVCPVYPYVEIDWSGFADGLLMVGQPPTP